MVNKNRNRLRPGQVRSSSALRRDIIDLLIDCAREAGKPRIGTREVEIVSFHRDVSATQVFRILTSLRKEGLIARSNGFCWLKNMPSSEIGKGD
jgi:hypothetical protein